ncbi:MAG: YwaF family protein [Clostridia bacterium]|jgi:hypothetical protein|nr:YwaF family protein [Clostridia bacterium]
MDHFDFDRYRYFDYKHNIEGYSGQDFDGAPKTWYMLFGVFSVPLFAFLLRKVSKERITLVLKWLCLFLVLWDVSKISWESWWDINTGRGFNAGGILPFDTCSLCTFILPAAMFGKGKIKESALAWVTVVGFIGGFASFVQLNALKWYPVLTFGANYSMLYHYIMVFVSVWIVFSGYLRLRPKHILYAFAVHAACSAVVITLDYVFKWDYMLYRTAGGVPLIGDLHDKLAEKGLGFLTTGVMLLIYFALIALIALAFMLIQRLMLKGRETKPAA